MAVMVVLVEVHTVVHVVVRKAALMVVPKVQPVITVDQKVQKVGLILVHIIQVMVGLIGRVPLVRQFHLGAR